MPETHAVKARRARDRLSAAEAASLVRPRKPNLFAFADDGETPNNPRCPLILYRSPVRLPEDADPAAVFETLFAAIGWKDSWRDGYYPYAHFHSHIHEALGVARGSAVVQFGGEKGRRIAVKAGDVVVLPAGVGHEGLEQSRDLL
ncbi:MAG: cupin, partial [Hyphomonadaceae bacterium]